MPAMIDAGNPIHIAAVAILSLVVCALLAAVFHRRALSIVYPVCLVASAVLLALNLSVLLSGQTITAQTMLGLPNIAFSFRLDPLSAFFAVVVNIGIVMASLYGLGLARDNKLSPRIEPFFPAFGAAMNAVLLADDAFSFLFSWEMMSVTSWALVLVRHEDEKSRHAAHVYLIMASIGTLLLLLAFAGMAGPAGSYAFDAIRAANLNPTIATLVLLAVLVGTGSKAGIIPFHVWLPLAHPAAPSHVSALMSGVMTKVAVYGLIRIVFDLLNETSMWAAAIILILGGVSALLGVLYALMQHDIKRLLAYHTVENIGIIFIGLGLALAFRANSAPALAALALTAALFHVLNHSLFKGLLFLGAGAVLHATGKRDLEQLGGLIHTMPATALAFLIGCIAISALPPLNGFVSEWLTFQAIIQSPALPQLPLKVLVPTVGAVLALSAALAAACFVKAFGITFLGRPRTDAAREAKEVNNFILVSLLVPCALCLLAGIFPGFVIDALAPVNLSLLHHHMADQSSLPWLSIVPVSQSQSSYSGLLILLFILVTACSAAYVARRLAANAVRRAPAWDCGFPDPSTQTQYTASSFAQPIRRVYGTVAFSARDQVEMPPPGSLAPARFETSLRDHIWEVLYNAPSRLLGNIATRLNVLHFLSIRRSLVLMFAALIALLVAVGVWF